MTVWERIEGGTKAPRSVEEHDEIGLATQAELDAQAAQQSSDLDAHAATLLHLPDAANSRGQVLTTNPESAVKVRYQPKPQFNLLDYNAPMNGVDDDQAAFDLLLADVPVGGGEIIIPGTCRLSNLINFQNRRSITLKGLHTGPSAGALMTSRLLFTGVALPRYIDCRSTFGVNIEGLMILFTDRATAASVIDYRHSSLLTDAAHGGINGCYIGPDQDDNTTINAILMNVEKAHSITARKTAFHCGKYAISGGVASTSISITDRCYFIRADVAAVHNPHVAWEIVGCVFQEQGRDRNKPGSVLSDALVATGLRFASNWQGDVPAGGLGDYLYLLVEGGVILGNSFGAGTNAVRFKNGSKATLSAGNYFNTPTNAYNFDAGVDSEAISMGPDRFFGVTTKWNNRPVRSITFDDTSGIMFGPDIRMYRGGADALYLDDSLWFLRSSVASFTTVNQVSGEAWARYAETMAGNQEWGGGTVARDVRQRRLAANVLGLDADDCYMTGKGATAARPNASAVLQGAQWFDTTLGKPIWSDGTGWRDATGAVV